MRKLERKWSRELAVVGVHSPKFSSERETEAIRVASLDTGDATTLVLRGL